MKWAILLLALAAASVSAQPKPYSAEYEVLRNGKRLGRGTVTLSDEGGTWLLASVTRGTKGLASLAGVEIVEKSILRWRDGRPETLDYRYRQEAAWKKRERSVRVDIEHGRVTSRDKDKVHEFVYEPFVLDRQVVALAMANDLAQGKRGELVYTVVDRDQFGAQTYSVADEETVDTPAGPQRALRVQRVREGERARVTTTWLGLDTDFVPVKIVQSEPDGDSFEMRLVSLER
jgi:hypothetical protein